MDHMQDPMLLFFKLLREKREVETQNLGSPQINLPSVESPNHLLILAPGEYFQTSCILAIFTQPVLVTTELLSYVLFSFCFAL